ncbi:MAG: hypothetical protein AAF753_09525 [Pseudomonadota bacterium]
MLRYLACAVFLWGVGPVAVGEGDLAREWSRAAAGLSPQVEAGLAGAPLPEEAELDLSRFAAVAGRLARHFDALDPGGDFACIFRGISEDAERQLRLLHMPGARQDALRRLSALLHDAEALGLAASSLARANAPQQPAANAASALASCPADPVSTAQYLIEQP